MTFAPVVIGAAVVPASIPLDALPLLFGLEWLRKGTPRLAGRRARCSWLSVFAALHESPREDR